MPTKYGVPRYTAFRVPRPRLSRAASKEARRSAVLLVAPPGYGKTVLLAEVVEELADPLVWLQLDENDNDPIAFVSALSEGTRRSFPEVAERLGRLDFTDTNGHGERLLAMVMNVFEDVGVGAWTMVIDDLHLIANPRTLALVAKLVEFPPPGLALLIASRIQPSLPLHRWVAQGAIRLFDIDDLRFTPEEARAWLRRDLPGLSDDAVGQLLERTEGWGAGLYLASGLLSGGTDGKSLAERLTGSNPVVGGYLMDEVFVRQSEELQEFLLSSAVLPQFDAASCSELLGITLARCERLIDQLKRQQAFLQPLDAEGRWYRYHSLFQEFLLGRLTRQAGKRAAELRVAAGHLAETRGQLVAAVGFYLEADDRVAAANLLENEGMAILNQGRAEALHRWLQQLGDEVAVSPRLQLLLGRVLRRLGRPQAASSVLKGVGDEADPRTLSAARTELAAIARSQGNYRGAADWARQAATAAGGDTLPGSRAAAMIELAKCEGHLKGMGVGRQVAERALEEFEAAGSNGRSQPGDSRLRATMLGELGQICWWHGDMEAAVAYLNEALGGLDELSGLRAADVQLALAVPTLYRHGPDAARRHAEFALSTYQSHEAKERIPAAYAVLGNVYTRAGDLDRAEALLRSAIALADEIDGASYDRLMAAGYLAHVLELQGRIMEAAQIATEALWAFEGEPGCYEAYVCRSVLADTHLGAGRWQEAKQIFMDLAVLGEQRHYRIPLAMVYFGLAYIELERGTEQAGIELAERAFDMLAPSHAWQLIVDQGQRAQRVLEALRPIRPSDPFIERVAIGLVQSPAAVHSRVRASKADSLHADVEVELLGELRVVVNGREVPARAFESSKARDLLAYLVVRRGETVTLDSALADLWPEEPNRAKTALHTALYRLRKALKCGSDDRTRFVFVESGRYRLDAARFDIDIDRFESLSAQARESPPERQKALLTQALGLVSGEVLAGLDYSWAAPFRSNLTRAISRNLRRLCELHLAAGELEVARAVSERYVRLDPFDERAHLLNVRVQHALGDLVEAELTYRRLRDLLEREMGVAPTAETERQYRTLMTQGPQE